MVAVFHAAVDDTQRMMQMGGGFGFDPSKVQIWMIYCRIFIILKIQLRNYSFIPWMVPPSLSPCHQGKYPYRGSIAWLLFHWGWHSSFFEQMMTLKLKFNTCTKKQNVGAFC